MPYREIGNNVSMNIKKVFRKVGSKVVESTKVAPKMSFNVETKAGAYNQYEQDKDLIALKNNLSKIQAEPMFEDNTPATVNTPKTPTVQTFVGGKQIDTSMMGTDFKVENINEVGHNISQVQPHFIISQGYFLLFDNGRTYFLKNTQQAERSRFTQTVVTLPTRLMKSNNTNTSGQQVCSENTVIFNDLQGSYRDLTKAEYDAIVKGKPSVKDLLSLYVQFDNKNKAEMLTSNAIPVW